MAAFPKCTLNMLAADLLESEVTDKIPSDMETLQTAFVRLQQLLDRAYQYVDDVVVRRCSCLLLPGCSAFDTAYVDSSDLAQISTCCK